MTYLKEFIKKIAAGNYHEFLKIWEEYCYSDQPDSEELRQILLEIKNSSLAELFGNHVEKGLILWEKLSPSPTKDRVLALIFDLQTTNSENLAQIAHQYLQEKYPQDPLFDTKLRIVGLRTKDHFQGALSHFELLSHIQKGKYVFHKAGWGAGEILDFSLIREDISLEFEYVIGTKTLSFENAMKTLIPLEETHFLAQRFGNPDLLEKKAKEDPLQVIYMLLKDLGPKNTQEIKEELCDLVIPESEWNKWWQNARTKIKKDTKIHTPKKSFEKFSLSEKEISHEELFYQELDAKPNIDTTIQMVYSFLKDFPRSLKNNEFTATLVRKIETILKNETLLNHQKIQLYFFLHAICKRDLTLAINLIKETKSLVELINSVAIVALQKEILLLIQQNLPDYSTVFLSLLFIVDSNIIRDFLFKELFSLHREEMTQKLKELLSSNTRYPEAFMWYFQKALDKKNSDLPFSDAKGQLRLFESFLTLLAYLSQKNDRLDLAKKMVHIVTTNRFSLIRKILEKTSLEEAKEFLLLISKCRLFSQHDMKIFSSLAKVVHPSLARGQKTEKTIDVVWATPKSYQKIQEKIKHLATVEMIHNAHEIEEARSHGDLRENAEYKAALEKKQQIQGELKILSDQFNQARIITKDLVNTSSVDIGTKVVCQSNGTEIVFTLLGPWDADPEKQILSLSSKLAQAMLHKKIGEIFHFQDKTYKIIAIDNALE
ncbi:MAG: GreA/GreB family elongation factor [Parachlamydiales bacterium]|nr:GreA/GreB family elongation factor [Parachlamydiales bacterium]